MGERELCRVIRVTPSRPQSLAAKNKVCVYVYVVVVVVVVVVGGGVPGSKS